MRVFGVESDDETAPGRDVVGRGDQVEFEGRCFAPVRRGQRDHPVGDESSRSEGVHVVEIGHELGLAVLRLNPDGDTRSSSNAHVALEAIRFEVNAADLRSAVDVRQDRDLELLEELRKERYRRAQDRACPRVDRVVNVEPAPIGIGFQVSIVERTARVEVQHSFSRCRDWIAGEPFETILELHFHVDGVRSRQVVRLTFQVDVEPLVRVLPDHVVADSEQRGENLCGRVRARNNVDVFGRCQLSKHVEQCVRLEQVVPVRFGEIDGGAGRVERVDVVTRRPNGRPIQHLGNRIEVLPQHRGPVLRDDGIGVARELRSQGQ